MKQKQYSKFQNITSALYFVQGKVCSLSVKLTLWITMLMSFEIKFWMKKNVFETCTYEHRKLTFYRERCFRVAIFFGIYSHHTHSIILKSSVNSSIKKLPIAIYKCTVEDDKC